MSGCTIDDCGRKIIAHDMCWKHYLRVRKYGDPRVNKRPNLFSGRSLHQDGYIQIHVGDNVYRFEHVLMAEKALGHSLPKGALVHHVDRDKANNNTKSPWNLVVCPNQSYHLLLHVRARSLGYEPLRAGYKLGTKEVAEIKSSKEPRAVLAKRYSVSIWTIKAIRAGKRDETYRLSRPGEESE